MIELHVERPDHPPMVRRFSAAAIVLGRASACDLPLDDSSVSRRHCRLVRGADGWSVEDLGSANGTIVDGLRITGARPLSPGTPINVGIFSVTLGAAPRTAAAPPPSPPAPAPTRRPRTTPRRLAIAALATTLAGAGGWTSARVWDTPLRLAAPTADCPQDDPAFVATLAALARVDTDAGEDATQTALAALLQAQSLPPACDLVPRAEAVLSAALARMPHQRIGRHDTPVQAIVAGDDGRWLAAGADDGRVIWWDLHADDLAGSAVHANRPVTAVQFADDHHLWSADSDGRLHLWTLSTTWTPGPAASTWPGVHTLLPAHDGRVIAFGAGRAAVLHADPRRPATPLSTGAALRTFFVAPGGLDVVAGDAAGKITRWHLERRPKPEPLTAHGGPIRAIAVRGGLVASVGDDDALRLVELDRRVRRRGPPLVLLAEVPVPVDRLVITGDTLVGAGPEGAVVTWDLSQRTRRLPAAIHDGHRGPVTALAATTAWAVTAGRDGAVRVWPTTPDEPTAAPPLPRACAALGFDLPGCPD